MTSALVCSRLIQEFFGGRFDDNRRLDSKLHVASIFGGRDGGGRRDRYCRDVVITDTCGIDSIHEIIVNSNDRRSIPLFYLQEHAN